MKPSEMRGTIGRKSHVVASSKRTRGHDQSKGRIGRLGNRHTKASDRVGVKYFKTSVLDEGELDEGEESQGKTSLVERAF